MRPSTIYLVVIAMGVWFFAAAPTATALTMEQAFAQCRAKLAGQSDPDGAAKQQVAIENCAYQRLRESQNDPKSAPRKKQ